MLNNSQFFPHTQNLNETNYKTSKNIEYDAPHSTV